MPTARRYPKDSSQIPATGSARRTEMLDPNATGTPKTTSTVAIAVIAAQVSAALASASTEAEIRLIHCDICFPSPRRDVSLAVGSDRREADQQLPAVDSSRRRSPRPFHATAISLTTRHPRRTVGKRGLVPYVPAAVRPVRVPFLTGKQPTASGAPAWGIARHCARTAPGCR